MIPKKQYKVLLDLQRTTILILAVTYLKAKQVLFGQIPLILPDVDIEKLSSVAGLYLDLLGNFSAGVDPMALECAEDAIEAALFDSEPVFQGLNHLPMSMRIFQVHVERWRINGAESLKSSLAAPEFHAALEVRVKNPHAMPLPQRLDGASFLPSCLL
jgi:hypothetical protein